MMKDPVNKNKAKALLEKALNQNDTYLQAVYLLARIYEEVFMIFKKKLWFSIFFNIHFFYRKFRWKLR